LVEHATVGAQPSLDLSKGRSLTVQAVRDPCQLRRLNVQAFCDSRHRRRMVLEAIEDRLVASGQLLLYVGEVRERSDEGGVSPVETLQRVCNSIGGGVGGSINVGFEVAEVSLCSALEGFMASIQGCL
jgi:hypothetical protein